MYLSAIVTLICGREMSLPGSTSFSFAQNMIHDFQYTILSSQWHCLRQMPQKLVLSATKKKQTEETGKNNS